MKVSTKLKILAILINVFGAIVIGLAFVFPEEFAGSTEPNFAFIGFGAMIEFASIGVWGMAFKPYFTKMKAKLHSETMDYAGEEVGDAINKTVDVGAPATKKIVKTVVSSAKEVLTDDVKEELIRAQKLYNEGIITKDEYEQLRKKILNL